MAERSAVEWAEAVRDAERRGELLTAFDLAERALEEHPDDLWLRHRAVLGWHAGSTDQAARRFREFGLTEVDTEDVATSRARIVKDIALGGEGAERRRAAARSAELYAAIHARTGGWYPAVNAATLSLVAGDPNRAREFARDALDALARHGDESYYAAATEAEADLVLGRPDAARDVIARAVARNDDDYGAPTTTRRQLRLVCQATGTDPAVLALLAGPAVVHFCGHRSAHRARGRASPPRPSRCSPPPSPWSSSGRRSDTPTALAAGADILWAEALLEHGAELSWCSRSRSRSSCARRWRPPALPGSSASTGASRRRRPSSTPRTTPWAAMTSCSVTAPSSPWARPASRSLPRR